MREFTWQFDYSFSLEMRIEGRAAWISFSGELDALTAKNLQLRAPIPLDQLDQLVLDLTALEYVDVTGVREIRRMKAVLDESGGRVEIKGANADVQHLLDMFAGNGARGAPAVSPAPR